MRATDEARSPSFRASRPRQSPLAGRFVPDPTRLTVFERAALVTLIGLLAFMPAVDGVVDAWSFETTLAGVALVTVLLAVGLAVSRRVRSVWSWACLPIALFAALVALQSIPFPPSFASRLSPALFDLKRSLLGSGSHALALRTLTIYPLATWRAGERLACVIGVFVATLQIARRPRVMSILLGAIACISGAVALIALAQNIWGGDRIYLIWPPVDHNTGTFDNHSQFGQYMTLSLGAAGALLLMRWQTARLDPYRAMLHRVSSFPGIHVALLGLLVLGASVVVLAMSRGATVSLAIGATLTLALITWRGVLPWRIVGAVLCAGAVVVGLIVLCSPSVAMRLRSLANLHDQASGRLQIVASLWPCWKAYPVWGTGLGTFEFIFPRFDRVARLSEIVTHAENEYAQLMTETGLVGVCLMLAFVGTIVLAGVRAMLAATREPACAGAFALLGALVAVLIHSFSDFGQHLPAVASLMAITCALLLNLAQLGRVVPNAVDAELFKPAADREACRRELGATGFVLGYFGRLVPEKGILDAVDAVALCPEDVSLLVVGRGPLRPVIEQRMAQLGMSASRVRFVENQPLEKLPALMNAIDALVLPSRTTRRWKEQFGRVIIEAHACATPVIGSSSGAIPQVIGEGGLVFPEGDVAALRQAILRLRDDAEGARAMGQCGYRQVHARYTWQRVADRMYDIYRKAIESGRVGGTHAASRVEAQAAAVDG